MTDQNENRPNPRKIREGLVVSTSMDKTAVVAIVDRVRHRRYNKTVQRTKKLFVHDYIDIGNFKKTKNNIEKLVSDKITITENYE